MHRPDRVPVPDALRVVPHPVGVDDAGAGLLGDLDHAPVDVGGHAGDHLLAAACRAAPASCLRTSSWLPPMPPEVTITIGALQLEVADLVAVARPARARTGRARAPCRSRRRRRRRSTSGRRRGGGSGARRGRAPARRARAHERLDHARPGAPGDVEARHGVAVPDRAVAAALGPADHRAAAGRPARAARRASRRRRSPRTPRPSAAATRPRAGRTPPCRASPASASSCESLDAQAPLLGAVDEEQAAERPERLAAERRLRLLVDERRPAGPRRPARPWRPARPARRRRRSRRGSRPRTWRGTLAA